jgi:sulfur relay (sulfurtransferase) complex TusBCD TusD component (DsrE family)
MSAYVLIESRDPFESQTFAQRCDVMIALAADGAAVTVFLVENGVLVARRTARAGVLEALSRAGVAVLADEFALRERGIAVADLADRVQPASLHALVERLGSGARVLWN